MPFCRLLLVIQYRAETKFGIGISEKSFLVDELELKLPGLVGMVKGMMMGWLSLVAI